MLVKPVVAGLLWVFSDSQAGVPVLNKLCTVHQMREVTFNMQVPCWNPQDLCGKGKENCFRTCSELFLFMFIPNFFPMSQLGVGKRGPQNVGQEFSPLLNQILNAETASESQNIAKTLGKQISDMCLVWHVKNWLRFLYAFLVETNCWFWWKPNKPTVLWVSYLLRRIKISCWQKMEPLAHWLKFLPNRSISRLFSAFVI